MIEELIARVFATRNAAHIEHWRTKSIAQHEALGAFYSDLIGSVDSLVEAHQGVFDLVSIGALDKQPKVPNIITHLEDDLLWIGKNRQKITQGLPAIDNILQCIEGVYLTALYKLKHLS